MKNFTENIKGIELGYACINLTLQENKKNKITCNRTMIKKTFNDRGIKYAAELSELNTRDLLPILEWNHKNNIKVFRMTSCLFPWASEYMLEDLPNFDKISKNLKRAGDYAIENGIRLSFHPGPFNILTSTKEEVVKNTVVDLSIHGKIMDVMGLPRNHWAKINIHIGAAYGDRKSAMERWIKNFDLLPESVKTRLTVENDDKESLFSTKDLYENIYKKIKVPIVFDYHHHKFRNDGESESECHEMAYESWGKIRPCFHYSESASLKEGSNKKDNAHSDYVYDNIESYGKDFDTVIEAKAKELALLHYRSIHDKRLI
jgi:UV DNA damage endonuclease